jgi:hypothetical protein
MANQSCPLQKEKCKKYIRAFNVLNFSVVGKYVEIFLVSVKIFYH